jgi:hypothetical protein
LNLGQKEKKHSKEFIKLSVLRKMDFSILNKKKKRGGFTSAIPLPTAVITISWQAEKHAKIY